MYQIQCDPQKRIHIVCIYIYIKYDPQERIWYSMTHKKEYNTVWPTKKNIYSMTLNNEYNTVWPPKNIYNIVGPTKKENNTVWPTKKNIYSMTLNNKYSTVWPTKKNIVQYDQQKRIYIE